MRIILAMLNPNAELVRKIKYRIEVTGGYCPCVPDKIGDEDYRCPCKKYREEEECCCGLFIKEN